MSPALDERFAGSAILRFMLEGGVLECISCYKINLPVMPLPEGAGIKIIVASGCNRHNTH